jgi:adenylosuccinate lyase
VLLALTQKGVSREDAYAIVQKHAMDAWRGKGRFVDLLAKDTKVSRALSGKDLQALFDLGYHTKHVDTIFRRVFGTGAPPPRSRSRVSRPRQLRRASR